MVHRVGSCRLWVRFLFFYRVWTASISIVSLSIPRKHTIASLFFLDSRSPLSYAGSKTFRDTYKMSRKVTIFQFHKTQSQLVFSAPLACYSLPCFQGCKQTRVLATVKHTYALWLLCLPHSSFPLSDLFSPFLISANSYPAIPIGQV